MQKNRQQRRRKKHSGLPPGMTYADKLAQDRAIMEAAGQAIHSKTVELSTDIRAQRLSWMAAVALNVAFGFGADRWRRFIETFQAVSDDFEQDCDETDAEYALEKLRQKAEAVSGMKITYLYEEEIKAAKKRQAEGGGKSWL